MAWLFWWEVLAAVFLLLGLGDALDTAYCSPDNTGSTFQKAESIYQSNGLCRETCSSQYAFAIIRGQDCWCSNFAPGDTVDTSQCDEKCPGFPDEECGSSPSGLYGYFLLDLPVLGTSSRPIPQPPSTTPTTTTTPVSVSLTSEPPSLPTFREPPRADPRSSRFFVPPFSRPALTVIPPQNAAPTSSAESAVKAPEQVSSRPSPSDTKTQAPKRTTLIPTPTTSATSTTKAARLVPSVVTVTQDGTTITSTAQVTPSSDPTLEQPSPPGEDSNSGQTAGIAVGAAVGLAAVTGFGFWLYLRRRRRNQPSPATSESDSGKTANGVPKRHASQMSQAGLIDKNPRVMTSGLVGDSSANSAGTSSQNNRYSAGTDMRLNPNAIYTHEEAQHSSVSLQDNRDYSRQLQIRNPDS